MTRLEHVREAVAKNKEAKLLSDHIAGLHGDAFGLRLRVQQLRDKAAWHLGYAEALRRNSLTST